MAKTSANGLESLFINGLKDIYYPRRRKVAEARQGSRSVEVPQPASKNTWRRPKARFGRSSSGSTSPPRARRARQSMASWKGGRRSWKNTMACRRFDAGFVGAALAVEHF